MGKCKYCKSNIGFLQNSTKCDECEEEFCDKCSNLLKECKECNGKFCPVCINKHKHEDEEESEEENEESDIKDYVTKQGKFIYFDFSDLEHDETLKFLEELEKTHEIDYKLTENIFGDNSTLVMREKDGKII